MKGADSDECQHRMHEVKIKKVKGEFDLYGEQIKGTRANEEHLESRRKIKGAASATGQHRMHEGENKMRRGEINDYWC